MFRAVIVALALTGCAQHRIPSPRSEPASLGKDQEQSAKQAPLSDHETQNQTSAPPVSGKRKPTAKDLSNP